MRNETISSIKHPSRFPSLWLLAAAICLCPAAAQAQTNTSTGYGALAYVTTGEYNTADGYAALLFNSSGDQNSASGAAALYNNTTGNSNTASGYAALLSNTTGRNNVAVGANALTAINGSNNIALGYNAGKNTTSGNDNIYIGHTGRRGGESKVMRIGKAQTKTYIAGIAGKALSGATVVVRSSGQLGVVASSARYKQNIRPLGDASGKLARLRPVSYSYKAEPRSMHYGLIAEDVAKVMPELVVRDGQNRPESVQYLEIIPLLLQEGGNSRRASKPSQKRSPRSNDGSRRSRQHTSSYLGAKQQCGRPNSARAFVSGWVTDEEHLMSLLARIKRCPLFGRYWGKANIKLSWSRRGGLMITRPRSFRIRRSLGECCKRTSDW